MKKISELLTGREVVNLPTSASALDAARAMTEHHVGAILVNDGATPRPGIAGIFTERDLMIRVVVAGKDVASTPLAEVMTKDVFTAGHEDRISALAREMQKRHIRHLPVVDGGTFTGLLSLRDLLREHLVETTGEVEALTSYIQGEAEGGQ
jgi:CBS domain-containing protein